nr:hypothetical protein CFP56_59318 [Quercus suber]
MFPENILKDKSKNSNPTKPRKVGREPDNLFPLKFKSLSPSILPQAVMNSFGIEGSWLLEMSRLSKESIWQSKGRKSEELRENPDSDILVTEEFPELHVTPLHEHGALVISHKYRPTLSGALYRDCLDEVESQLRIMTKCEPGSKIYTDYINALQFVEEISRLTLDDARVVGNISEPAVGCGRQASGRQGHGGHS